MSDEEPKIIIDEGWKSQVERERDESTLKAEEAAQAPEDGEQPEGLEDVTLFEAMFSGMAAQTMMSLGLMPEEGQTQVMVDLPLAKHLIDTLGMLQEKTKGNLTEREETNLAQAVTELQHAFAVRAQQAQASAMQNQGINPGDLPGNPL